MSPGLVAITILFGGLGWIAAFYFHGMYKTQKWYCRELRKIHVDALKHWDETRAALRAALSLFPAAIKSPEKEFKS